MHQSKNQLQIHNEISKKLNFKKAFFQNFSVIITNYKLTTTFQRNIIAVTTKKMHNINKQERIFLLIIHIVIIT